MPGIKERVQEKAGRIICNALKPLIVPLFHNLYYSSTNWAENTYLGYPILQTPVDIQLYQEVIYKLNPETIIQTGIASGGSLLYFASLMDLIGQARTAKVIGVDITLTDQAKSIAHPRVTMLEGSSTDPKIVEQIKSMVIGKCMVVLDSDHSKSHVDKELSLYADLVSPGSYLAVEDTNVNGHPVSPTFGPGPREAVKQFLATDKRFAQDRFWAKNLYSFHDWLKRLN